LFSSIIASQMKTLVLLSHLIAVGLAALALWSIRHELTEKATRRLTWAVTPALAIVVTAILLIVSPGKRYELWVAAIVIGLGVGAIAAVTLKINQDFGKRLLRVARAWDGAAAATLLLLLAIARVVTSHLLVRESGKFGVLGAAAAFLAAYLAARYFVARFFRTHRAIHLDMFRGVNPQRTLVA
jgi:NAD/NADP transhydrogenase beta subunit